LIPVVVLGHELRIPSQLLECKYQQLPQIPPIEVWYLTQAVVSIDIGVFCVDPSVDIIDHEED
jgi:hypothetical protein